MRTDIRVDTSELQALAARLKTVNDKVKTKELRNILKQAAKPILTTVKASVPVSKRTRAKGGKYETTPGNLARSMKIFVAKKGIAVHVGARVDKGFVTANAKGNLSFDGYYNFFVNFGTKYQRGQYHMDMAEKLSLPLAERLATVEMKKYLTKVINRAK